MRYSFVANSFDSLWSDSRQWRLIPRWEYQRTRSFPDGGSCRFFLRYVVVHLNAHLGILIFPMKDIMTANVDQDAPVQIIPQWGKLLFFSKRRNAMPLLMLIAPMQVIAWQWRAATNYYEHARTA